jgi:outer membrane protein TolC
VSGTAGQTEVVVTAFIRFVARGVIAGTLCLGGGVRAQTPAPTGPDSLAQAVEAAWQRAAESVETQGQVHRARADVVTASAPWAAPPAIELAHRDDRPLTDAGARETDVGIAVPLWLPGQRTARLASARAGDEAAQGARDAARLHVAGRVREAVWDVVLQRAEVALAQAQTESLDALAADVDRRVAAGDLARADALAARAELVTSAAARALAQTRLQVSLTRWQTLTGMADIPAGTASIEAPSAVTLSDEHPVLRLADRQVELARKRLDAVNASRRSPPELLARIRTEVSSRAESTQNSIGIGLRVPLATDDRNAPLMAAASAELDVAVATAQRLRRQLQADVDTSRALAQAAFRQITDQQERVRLLRERATLLDRSFRAGETSLPDMLRVLSAAAQADAALERQRADAGLARARLEHALGHQP